MLISKEQLSSIDSELAGIIKGLTQYVEGDGKSPSLLELVYLAGKVAAEAGPDFLKDASEADLLLWIKKNGVERSKEDDARIAALREATQKWIASLQEDLTRRVRVEIATAEEDWVSQVLTRGPDGLRKSIWDSLKKKAVAALTVGVGKVLENFITSVDRLFQTELAKYFQVGQTTGVSGDELVYKVPRLQACPHCMRLHVDATGKPIEYKLRDVEQNSNVGRKASEWVFVVGPTHPHCYCILYRSAQKPPKPWDLMAIARKESLAVGLKKRKELAEEAKRKYEEAKKLAST